MKNLLIIAFITTVCFANAQESTVRKLSARPTGVEISTGIQATVVKSNRNEVVLEASEKRNLEKIETKVSNGF